MASKTEIANRALIKVGERRVSNVETTDTEAARTINELYDTVRDAVLSSYPWNFSIKRANLAPDATSPVWEWNYAYTVPSDFLSLVCIKDNPEYDFENNKILTDEGTTLYIKYISKVTNTGLYSPVFVEAFSALLAAESIEKITQSNTKKAALQAEYERIIRRAHMIDAQENPIKDLELDEWVTSRL